MLDSIISVRTSPHPHPFNLHDKKNTLNKMQLEFPFTFMFWFLLLCFERQARPQMEKLKIISTTIWLIKRLKSQIINTIIFLSLLHISCDCVFFLTGWVLKLSFEISNTFGRCYRSSGRGAQHSASLQAGLLDCSSGKAWPHTWGRT